MKYELQFLATDFKKCVFLHFIRFSIFRESLVNASTLLLCIKSQTKSVKRGSLQLALCSSAMSAMFLILNMFISKWFDGNNDNKMYEKVSSHF